MKSVFSTKSKKPQKQPFHIESMPPPSYAQTSSARHIDESDYDSRDDDLSEAEDGLSKTPQRARPTKTPVVRRNNEVEDYFDGPTRPDGRSGKDRDTESSNAKRNVVKGHKRSHNDKKGKHRQTEYSDADGDDSQKLSKSRSSQALVRIQPSLSDTETGPSRQKSSRGRRRMVRYEDSASESDDMDRQGKGKEKQNKTSRALVKAGNKSKSVASFRGQQNYDSSGDDGHKPVNDTGEMVLVDKFERMSIDNIDGERLAMIMGIFEISYGMVATYCDEGKIRSEVKVKKKGKGKRMADDRKKELNLDRLFELFEPHKERRWWDELKRLQRMEKQAHNQAQPIVIQEVIHEVVPVMVGGPSRRPRRHNPAIYRDDFCSICGGNWRICECFAIDDSSDSDFWF